MVLSSGNGATVTPSTMLTCPGFPFFQMGVAQQQPVLIQHHPGYVQLSQEQGLSGIYALPLIRFCVPLDKVSSTLLLPKPWPLYSVVLVCILF